MSIHKRHHLSSIILHLSILSFVMYVCYNALNKPCFKCYLLLFKYALQLPICGIGLSFRLVRSQNVTFVQFFEENPNNIHG